MKIAIVHYHLRRGGVTRVIETALQGFREAGAEVECVVLSGEAPEETSPLFPHHRVVPGLGYAKEATANSTLADDLLTAATDALGAPPDVWHVHNHSLGKNVAMPLVLDRLLATGAKLLLQIHDFAEDGRPENFRRQRVAVDPAETTWYPSASQIHYALLNQRDAHFLGQAGLAADRLHLLPNAVAAPPVEPATMPAFVKPGQRFLLYPTRGIRRKNLGEMLLLAAISGDDVAFASTLAPENPEWLAIHDRWKALAAHHRLPVELGIGSDSSLSFGGLMAAADAILTTSVAEGFGLAFLEPWLAGKTIRGRDLPEITGDFAEKGIDLGGLYQRLDVPVDWIDAEEFRRKLNDALNASFQSYGRRLPDKAIEEAFHAAVTQGRVDFGRLDEALQERVLEAAIGDRDAIEPPDLSGASADEIAANASAIADAYGIAAYGRRLAGIYRELCDAPLSETDSLDGEKLLDAFLDPSRFMLLRS